MESNNENEKYEKKEINDIEKETNKIETEMEIQKHTAEDEYNKISKEFLTLKSNEKKLEKKIEENKEENNNNFIKFIISLEKNKYFILAIAIIIILIGIYLRIGMLKYTGLFEPDGFFHYSIMQQIIANHFIEPVNTIYSGFPISHYIEEPDGLYYVTIIPYFILRFFNVSLYNLMRIIPVLFGIADIIGCFFLIKFLSKNNYLSLLAMFFVAISNGDIARTAALVYRGDGFITIFMIITLILILKTLQSRNNKKYIFALGAGIISGIGIGVWNGSPFTLLIFILSMFFIIIYSFLISNKNYAYNSILLVFALLISHLIQKLFYYLTIIRVKLPFTDWHFFIFLIPLLIFSIISFYLIKTNKPKFIMKSFNNRLFFIILLIIIAVIILLSVFYNYILFASTGYGMLSRNSPLGITIEELLPPTYAFVFASFYYQLYLAPIAILLFFSILIFIKLYNKFYSKFKKLNFQSIDKNYTGNSLAFLIILAYFILTSYLQYTAIRYNSLVSIPIALFSAYTIYLISILVFKLFKKIFKSKQNLLYYAFIAYIAVLFLFFFYSFMFSHIQAYSSRQADNINPSFLSAMTWLKNNSPKNATVLALWPDGSVIEGWAHRRSSMDSVSGQIASNIYPFAKFVFNSSNDFQYLSSIHKPNYLVVRYFWFYELGGIAQEAELNISNPNISSQYSYVMMNSLNITKNASAINYLFTSRNFDVKFVTKSSKSGTKFAAYLLQPRIRPQSIRNIIFYNETNKNYSIATANTLFPTLNFSLLIYYSGHNIEGGAIIGPKLLKSNMFKFLILCNNFECPFNSNTISLNLVYSSNDTRIYKINYLN